MAIRGLELSEEKTLITNIHDGFDFLGWNFRKYNHKLIIKPSGKSIKHFSDKLTETVRYYLPAPQELLILKLNQKLRGWCNYHSAVCSKETFEKMDYLLYPVYMSEHEASLYDDMEAEMFLPLRTGEITAANAAALSGKLLQMANGAVYSDDGDEIQIHDQKLDALEDLIEAANGKPVMVAYWFKHDLTRIRRRLSERKISFEKLDSEESIRKWNRGELPVALIHPASAGHGFNLQSGGNILIWFGLTWSLELYQQTVARLWRQGQSAETVVVQHIITAGTIDEDVVKALANKDMTQNRLIAAVKARVTHGR